MKEKVLNFLKKGNKKSGAIFVLIFSILILSALFISYPSNPLYLLLAVTIIPIFGDLIATVILIFGLFFVFWWFFNLNFSFLNTKRVIGFVIVVLSIAIFIEGIEASTIFGPAGFISLSDYYTSLFTTPYTTIFIDHWTKPVYMNLEQMGFILPLVLWIFGGWGLSVFAPIIFFFVIVYGLYVVIFSDFQILLEKVNVFSKKENVKIEVKTQSIDLNDPTMEFQMHLSPKELQKLEIAERVKTNIDKTTYQDLSKQMKSEKERLEKLREKVLQKSERAKTSKDVSSKSNSEILDLLGVGTSFSKIKAEAQKAEEVIETTNEVEEEPTLASSFIVEDYIPTSERTVEESVEVIQEYYNEIYENSEKLIEDISKTLEDEINIESNVVDEEITEVILDNVKVEETVEEHIEIAEKTAEQEINTSTITTSYGYEYDEEDEEDEEEVLKPQDWCKPYVIPSTSILSEQSNSHFDNSLLVNDATEKSKKLNELFTAFSVQATVNSFEIGPTITMFKIVLEPGIKTTKITNLEDNIKLSLGAEYIRIIAPIPGTSFIGIEVPNAVKKPVLFKTVFDQTQENSNNGLQISIGQDVAGKSMSFDLTKAPHLLVAGSTGSGKSVAINTILASLILRYKPEDLQLVLIDPKMVEFTPFHEIPHLMAPVITDPTNASNALKALVNEMEDRYRLMSELGVKKIEELNERLISEGKEKAPYIVAIIDELADLMVVAAKEVEESIMRITQKARAAGIHMIVATQRPSTEIITGTIKSNIPSRMAFTVASSIDSRTILGQVGAEKLIGMGDMLVSLYGQLPVRGQGAYISNEEIEDLTSYVKNQCKPFYKIKLEDLQTASTFSSNNLVNTNDPLYIAARDTVIHYQKASTSMLQRHLNVGYNKAANLIETLEAEGVISPAKGSKPREILVEY